MTAQVRRDVLTGALVAVTALNGKPRPLAERHLPGSVDDGACAFCNLVRQSPRAGATLDDQGVERLVLDDCAAAFTVANRFPLFSRDQAHDDHAEFTQGRSDLVIANTHAVSLEQLDDAGARGFGHLLDASRRRMSADFERVGAWLNVGIEAGGSQAHLHGQVVAADLPGTAGCGAARQEDCVICADREQSRAAGLHVTDGPDWSAYVPWAPGYGMELRISAAGCCTEDTLQAAALLAGTRACLAALNSAGAAVAYNVILHDGCHPHAHLLLRIDPGVGFQAGLDVVPIPFDLDALASTLRDHLDAAQCPPQG